MLHTALRSIKWWFMFQNAGESIIVPWVHWRSSESPALVGPLADLLLCRWGLSGNKKYLLVIIIPLRVLMAAIIVNGMSPLDFYQQRSFSLESPFIITTYVRYRGAGHVLLVVPVPGVRHVLEAAPADDWEGDDEHVHVVVRDQPQSVVVLLARRVRDPDRYSSSILTSVYFRVQYPEKAATVALSVVKMSDISTVLTLPLSGPHPECIPWWSSPWWWGCTLWRTLHFSACSENMFSPPTHRRLQL